MHVVYMGPTERGEQDKFLWFLIRHRHLQIGITKIETIQDKIDVKNHMFARKSNHFEKMLDQRNDFQYNTELFPF